MLILLTIQQVISKLTNSDLQQRIYSLQLSNDFLHDQLLSCSGNDPSKIQEDVSYNKEKLKNLIEEYHQASENIFTAEEIKFTLNSISEDLKLLNTNSEDSSTDQIDNVVNSLSNSITQAKFFSQSQDFAKAYNKLQYKLEQLNTKFSKLLKKNAKIQSQLDSKSFSLENLQNLYTVCISSKNSLEEKIEFLNSQQQQRLETLQNSFSLSNEANMQSELSNINKIQSSENFVISTLSNQNKNNSVTIEQLTTDTKSLENTILSLKTTIHSLVFFT